MKVYFLDEQFLNQEEKGQLYGAFTQEGIEITFLSCKKSQEIIQKGRRCGRYLINGSTCYRGGYGIAP